MAHLDFSLLSSTPLTARTVDNCAMVQQLFPGWDLHSDDAHQVIYVNHAIPAVIRRMKGAGYQHAPVRLEMPDRPTSFHNFIPEAVLAAKAATKR